MFKLLCVYVSFCERSIQQWQRRCNLRVRARAYVCAVVWCGVLYCVYWFILIVEFLTGFTTPNFPKRTRNFLVLNFPFHKICFCGFFIQRRCHRLSCSLYIPFEIHSVFPNKPFVAFKSFILPSTFLPLPPHTPRAANKYTPKAFRSHRNRKS